MYTASDLRNMKNPELYKELRNMSKDLYLLRVESANNQLKQHHKIKKLRKCIARIQTVLAAKRREATKTMKEEKILEETKKAA